MMTRRWNLIAWRGITAGFLVSVIGVARAADVPAVTTGTIMYVTAGIPDSFTYGWTFQTNSDLVVTNLGLWDWDGLGLYHSHPVGLWNSSQQLLASATVPAGMDGALVNDFRYVPITPVELSANETYYLGALYLRTEMDCLFIATPAGTGNNSYAMDPALSAPVSGSTRGSTLTCPTPYPSPPDAVILGPNFLFHAVPEPSSLVLLAAGAVAFSVRVWRRRRRTV
jgi:hypothetical protein